MTWYSGSFHPPFIHLAHAHAPEMLNAIDPAVFDALQVDEEAPVFEQRPRSYYSTPNDAVYFNPSAWWTYKRSAYPDTPRSSTNSGHMVPSSHYPDVHKRIEDSLRAGNLEPADKTGLEESYSHVQRAMENPWGYVALAYPHIHGTSQAWPHDIAKRQMSTLKAHEDIHRVQSEYGHGEPLDHLPSADFDEMKEKNPYWKDIAWKLQHSGNYQHDPKTVGVEGAAFLGSGAGPNVFLNSPKEARRRSYLWLHNYINFLLERHGPQAARAMFTGAHPEVKRALEDAVAHYQEHGKVNWLNPKHRPEW